MQLRDEEREQKQRTGQKPCAHDLMSQAEMQLRDEEKSHGALCGDRQVAEVGHAPLRVGNDSGSY